MAVWKKGRFLSLKKEDDVDRVMAGSQFVVQYIGSTHVNELEKTEGALMEFYCNVVKKFQLRRRSLFRLIVDLSEAVLYDSQGTISQRFELSNIRDVIYCNKIREYLRHFVLVGQEEGDMNVQAHVFVCENKTKAKSLYETFFEAFTLAAQMHSFKRQTSVNDVYLSSSTRENPSNVENNKRTTNKVKEHSVLKNENNLCNSGLLSPDSSDKVLCLGDSGLGSNGNNEPHLEDCFTELARSRARLSDGFRLSQGTPEDANNNTFQDFTSDDNVCR